MGLVVPPAIIIINNDITTETINFIAKQLHIDEIIDGYELSSRVSADPAYPNLIKQFNQRIMVTVESYQDILGPELRRVADVAIYVKGNLASVQKNNFGPPNATYSITNLHWSQLCIRDVNFDVDGTQNNCGGCNCSSTITHGYYLCPCCNPSKPSACVSCGDCCCSVCNRCTGCGNPIYSYGSASVLIRANCLACGRCW